MMSAPRRARIAEAGAAEKQLRSRCQRYCRSLIIAASVAFQQFGPDQTSRLRENPPYVQLLEESPKRFSQKEIVGRSILTMDFIVPDDTNRKTGSLN